jgi:hypothetical protein
MNVRRAIGDAGCVATFDTIVPRQVRHTGRFLLDSPS